MNAFSLAGLLVFFAPRIVTPFLPPETPTQKACIDFIRANETWANDCLDKGRAVAADPNRGDATPWGAYKMCFDEHWRGIYKTQLDIPGSKEKPVVNVACKREMSTFRLRFDAAGQQIVPTARPVDPRGNGGVSGTPGPTKPAAPTPTPPPTAKPAPTPPPPPTAKPTPPPPPTAKPAPTPPPTATPPAPPLSPTLVKIETDPNPPSRDPYCAPVRARNTHTAPVAVTLRETFKTEGPGCNESSVRDVPYRLEASGQPIGSTEYLGCASYRTVNMQCTERRSWVVLEVKPR